MPLLDLRLIPRLATTEQNDDHLYEAELINTCVEALRDGSHAVSALLEQLSMHVRRHFAREYAAMHRAGFSLRMHHQDHQRIAFELELAVARFQADGDRRAARRALTREVGPRFVAHVRTMDVVADQWMSMRMS